MSPKTLRKRAKKLVKELFELQQFDIDITPQRLLATKFLLRHSKYCIQVRIKFEPGAGCITDFPRSPLPNFILSQLEAQKLIDTDSRQVPLSEEALFVLSSLPSRPSRKTSHPTLFRWQHPDNHRTHIIFAFISDKMSSRTYSIDELVSLRNNGDTNGLETAATKNAELGHIIRPVKSINNLANCPTNESKDPPFPEEDQILFKGKMPRRSAQNEAQWKYRGRSGSENTSNEPISAPSELNTQKSEGFQRFYKAVVSPTHVRVTAGGRIVPNTRALPQSPVSRRFRDKLEAEDKNFAGQPAKPQPGTSQNSKETAAIPTMHPFYGFHPGMGPIPMVPMPMGPNMHGAFPPPTYRVSNEQAHPSGTTRTSASDTSPRKTLDGAGEQGSDQDQASNDFKVSPPGNFNPWQPFFHRGQWVFPVPPGYPPPFSATPFVHAPMVANPGFQPPHFAGNMMFSPHYPMGAMMPTMGFQQPPMMTGFAGLPHMNASNTAPFCPPTAPPPSSIRPSEITKKQIECLKQGLKYHEDQLRYNKHQVDERNMENQIIALSEEIQRFEEMLKTQLRYEGKHYPGEKEGSTESDPAPRNDNTGAKQTSSSSRKESRSAYKDGYKTLPLRRKDASVTKRGSINSLRNDAAFKYGGDPGKAKNPFHPARKTGLPSGAALAPPFQPRSTSLANDRGQRGIEKSKSDTLPFDSDVQKASEERLLAAAAGSWTRGFGMSGPSSGLSSKSIVNSETEHVVHDARRSREKHASDVPYLVGTLPRGIDPKTARDSDYVYSRDLTDDELRARFLYWGKAPKFVKQGLPKYDGKDFYPPSPTKEFMSEESIIPSISRTSPRPSGSHNDKPIGMEFSDPFRGPAPGSRQRMSRGMVSGSGTRAVTYSMGMQDQLSTSFGDGGETSEDQVSESRSTGSNDNLAVIEELEKTPVDMTNSQLLQSLLGRDITASEALPSAVTSTNVQGYVPSYMGHGLVTASLNPGIPNAIGSARSFSSPGKGSENGGVTVTPIPERRGENRPPVGIPSLEEQFRNIATVENDSQETLSSPWRGR